MSLSALLEDYLAKRDYAQGLRRPLPRGQFLEVPDAAAPGGKRPATPAEIATSITEADAEVRAAAEKLDAFVVELSLQCIAAQQAPPLVADPSRPA